MALSNTSHHVKLRKPPHPTRPGIQPARSLCIPHRSRQVFWQGHHPRKAPRKMDSYDNKLMGFNVVYTTSAFPVSLNDDIDIKTHDELSATGNLGLANKNGTVCRIVDFGPGFDCMMHRTQSLAYGIVLDGSIELVLDSGDRQLMHRGDVAVQRSTMHAWYNPSKTEWAHMPFVLQDCETLVLDGHKLKEDLGRAAKDLPPSGNDD
ncbi:hypothetical protein LCI18_008606 [Fusarium solani-melongenae]|uniref:Uncharacterized protein n=1 Tax=Fusarium solani subsp. cucurbitae TaxID=2747967 RepID=A0ACD3Z9Z5_FUSSC|nr:hypothetical protein LCI18_008606 [Fusarium solani-melongenae]